MARLAQMKTKQIAMGVFLLPLSLGAPGFAGAQTAYPSMAPIEQYLSSSPAAEIAQARAAAPPSISNDAEILTLGAHGYETAVKGKNGFVCMVQRSWDSGLDDDEFWNPKGRAPICFNPAGARSVLPGFLKRTQWVLSGLSRAEIKEHLKAAVAANEIPAPEVGTITFMLAKDAYHSDRVHGPWHPHLMFFLPRMSVADWGANLPGSQVMGGTGSIEPYTVFFVPVAKWSDGTPDTQPMPNM
jgi:hypothetical protein